MAIIQNTIIGRASGSVDAVTFQTWKRRNILRSRPVDVYNPRTEKQLIQRANCTGATKFYTDNVEVLRPLFSRLDSGYQPIAAFLRKNLKLWVNGTERVEVGNLNKMFLGRGELTRLVDVELTYNSSFPAILSAYCFDTLIARRRGYFTGAIIYNQTTGQSFCGQVKNWSGRNYIESTMFCSETDVVVAWVFSYSIVYGYFTTPVMVYGQFVVE